MDSHNICNEMNVSGCEKEIKCKNTPLEGEYIVNIYDNGTCEFAISGDDGK